MKRRLFACTALLTAALASAQTLRDPMQPPHAAARSVAARPAGPVLSAVLISGAHRGVIFNGQFVRSGGSVGGYQIVAVLDDGVRYRHAGRLLELHLPPTLSFKKTAGVVP